MGGNEYEVVYFGQDKDDALTETTWMAKDALMKLTWTDTDKKKTEYALGPALEKLMMQVDERIAFEQSGIGMKKLSTLNIQKHLDQFNLEAQFGTYSKMHALSGGQKVKVVLAAAMWMQPHILILDEPTNYLDRDSLGALAGAIEVFDGGVVMITHNNEFCSALCPETWLLEGGKLDCKGDAAWMENIMKEKDKKLSRKEIKAMAKVRKAKLERGEELSDDEDWDPDVYIGSTLSGGWRMK